MKIVAAITIAVSFTVAVDRTGAEESGPALSIYIHIPTDNPRAKRTCMLAEVIASNMLASVGIPIRWRTGHPDAFFESPIIIELSTQTPAKLNPGGLGYARVFEGTHIRIFFDRIEEPSSPRTSSILLAHVLVHEIAHLLEGVDRHSSEGVMKAQWNRRDLLDMRFQPLAFAAEDVQLIRHGYEIRCRTKTAWTCREASIRAAAGSKIVKQTLAGNPPCVRNGGERSSSSITQRSTAKETFAKSF